MSEKKGEQGISVGAGIQAASVSSGFYEFIPLPFVDDWAIGRQRKGVVEAILKQRGIDYDEEVPGILAGGGKSLFSRIGSFTRGLVTKPLRKVFRSVLIWLTVRRAARTALETYFLARLLHHPDLLAESAGNRLDKSRAKVLAEVFGEVAKGIDYQAAKNAIAHVAKLFARPGKASEVEVSEKIEESAPGFIARFDALAGAHLRKSQ